MKINWTVRLKNKVWLATFLSFIVSTVYQWLGYFDIAPVVTQDAVLQLVTAVLQAAWPAASRPRRKSTASARSPSSRTAWFCN